MAQEFWSQTVSFDGVPIPRREAMARLVGTHGVRPADAIEAMLSGASFADGEPTWLPHVTKSGKNEGMPSLKNPVTHKVKYPDGASPVPPHEDAHVRDTPGVPPVPPAGGGLFGPPESAPPQAYAPRQIPFDHAVEAARLGLTGEQGADGRPVWRAVPVEPTGTRPTYVMKEDGTSVRVFPDPRAPKGDAEADARSYKRLLADKTLAEPFSVVGALTDYADTYAGAALNGAATAIHGGMLALDCFLHPTARALQSTAEQLAETDKNDDSADDRHMNELKSRYGFAGAHLIAASAVALTAAMPSITGMGFRMTDSGRWLMSMPGVGLAETLLTTARTAGVAGAYLHGCAARAVDEAKNVWALLTSRRPAAGKRGDDVSGFAAVATLTPDVVLAEATSLSDRAIRAFASLLLANPDVLRALRDADMIEWQDTTTG